MAVCLALLTSRHNENLVKSFLRRLYVADKCRYRSEGGNEKNIYLHQIEWNFAKVLLCRLEFIATFMVREVYKRLFSSVSPNDLRLFAPCSLQLAKIELGGAAIFTRNAKVFGIQSKHIIQLFVWHSYSLHNSFAVHNEAFVRYTHILEAKAAERRDFNDDNMQVAIRRILIMTVDANE